MRAGAISAGLFGFARETGTSEQDAAVGQKKPVASTTGSGSETYAAEQIRSLVRQVFLSGALPAQQVVFTSIQPEIDVRKVCRKVAQGLAGQTSKDVVIVTRCAHSDLPQGAQLFNTVRSAAKHEQGNLWGTPLDTSQWISIALFLLGASYFALGRRALAQTAVRT